MSGDEVRMADNAYLMIHNARGGVMGERRRHARLRRHARQDRTTTSPACTRRRPASRASTGRALMDAETWFTADEAKAEGLVDTVYTQGI
jgi:ATP-dependent protease ClpP protease subunit